MSRHPAIKSALDFIEFDKSYYRGSPEILSSGAPLARLFDFTRLGIHYELLPPGRRTSWPHAESTEDEFVYVIEGYPEVWLDGQLYPLKPGDAVGFKAGDGLAHTFLNNSEHPVRLMVVGDKSREDNKVHYPLHPQRNLQIGKLHWEEVDRSANPHRPVLGPHDGMTDQWRSELQQGPVLRVRSLEERDFQFILNYWTASLETDLARMGCDAKKFASEDVRRAALAEEIKLSDSDKKVCHLIWEVDGKAIAHTNLKRIQHGTTADIHLHMWSSETRGKGLGGKLFDKSLIEFFRRFKLNTIICEPSSGNPFPNRMLQKMGFKIAKTYVTTPSELALEGEVNRYEITKAYFNDRPFLVRFARPQDSEGVAPLIEALGYGRVEAAQFKMRFDDILSMPGLGVLVGDHPVKGIQGYLSYSVKPQLRFARPQLAIDEIAVSEAYRGQKIGSILLAQAQRIAASLRCEQILVLTDRKRASFQRGFYVKHGFEELDCEAVFIKRMG